METDEEILLEKLKEVYPKEFDTGIPVKDLIHPETFKAILSAMEEARAQERAKIAAEDKEVLEMCFKSGAKEFKSDITKLLSLSANEATEIGNPTLVETLNEIKKVIESFRLPSYSPPTNTKNGEEA